MRRVAVLVVLVALAGVQAAWAGAPPGGSLKLKTSNLIGNSPVRVSGKGWSVDTSVALSECTTAFFADASCTHLSVLPVVRGGFIEQTLGLLAGKVGHGEGACSTGGGSSCYLVGVGTNGGEAARLLTFKPPNATAKRTAGVANGYLDVIKARNFPAGDTVVAGECDSAVAPATDLAERCDPATEISGEAGAKGKVVFPVDELAIASGADYSEEGAGRCEPSGSCTIVVSDLNEPSVYFVVPITLTS